MTSLFQLRHSGLGHYQILLSPILLHMERNGELTLGTDIGLVS